MADSHKLLNAIDQKLVRLTDAKRNVLQEKALIMEGRLQDWLVGYGGVIGLTISRYGSFQLDTIVNPFDVDRQYDVDMGVELLFNDELSYQPQTYLRKLYDEMCTVFNEPEFKSFCVRANYSLTETVPNFHIDVSLYRKSIHGRQIAAKIGEWKASDPLEFVNWFESEARQKQHLKTIVRLLKWWAQSYWTEMPSGLVLTILSAQAYMDDTNLGRSFRKTIEAICAMFAIQVSCSRPTTPAGEDLLAPESKSFKQTIRTRFEKLSSDIGAAIDENDVKRTIELWNRIFDGRIPNSMTEHLKNGLEVQLGYSDGYKLLDGGAIAAASATEGSPFASTKFYGKS